MGCSSLQTACAWVTTMKFSPCAPVVDPPGAGGGDLYHCGSPWAEGNPCSSALRTSCPSFFTNSTLVSTGLFLISLTPLSHSCHAASLSFLKYVFPEVVPSWLMPCGGSIGTGWSQQFPAIPQLLLHQHWASIAELIQADGHLWSRLRCHQQQECPSLERMRVYPTGLTW